MKRLRTRQRTVARGVILLAITAIFFLSPLTDSGRTQAADRLTVGTIKAGLRVPEQENQGFVELVVDMVNQGELPRSIVDSAFLWAKAKETLRFQYFKRAVIVLARQRGIRL